MRAKFRSAFAPGSEQVEGRPAGQPGAACSYSSQRRDQRPARHARLSRAHCYSHPETSIFTKGRDELRQHGAGCNALGCHRCTKLFRAPITGEGDWRTVLCRRASVFSAADRNLHCLTCVGGLEVAAATGSFAALGLAVFPLLGPILEVSRAIAGPLVALSPLVVCIARQPPVAWSAPCSNGM